MIMLLFVVLVFFLLFLLLTTDHLKSTPFFCLNAYHDLRLALNLKKWYHHLFMIDFLKICKWDQKHFFLTFNFTCLCTPKRNDAWLSPRSENIFLIHFDKMIALFNFKCKWSPGEAVQNDNVESYVIAMCSKPHQRLVQGKLGGVVEVFIITYSTLYTKCKISWGNLIPLIESWCSWLKFQQLFETFFSSANFFFFFFFLYLPKLQTFSKPCNELQNNSHQLRDLPNLVYDNVNSTMVWC